MLKVNDIVVIDKPKLLKHILNSIVNKKDSLYIKTSDLDKNKTYKVLSIRKGGNNNIIVGIEDNFIDDFCQIEEKFLISVRELRKNKIEKLNEI